MEEKQRSEKGRKERRAEVNSRKATAKVAAARW